MEGSGPSFLLSKILRALGDLSHCSMPIFISSVPLTFSHITLLAAFHIYMTVLLPFPHSVPLLILPFPF